MIKRNDILLIVGIVLLVGALYVVKSIFMDGSSSDYVEVRVDGELVAEYSLSEDREVMLEAPDGSGYNKLVIKDGAVSITEADCPDKHCVHKGFVSGVNETIICLPHRLVVKLCGDGENAAPDIVAQ